METLLLSRKDVAAAIDMRDVIEGVKQGYMAYQNGSLDQPPVVSMVMPKNHADCDVKCCYNQENDAMTVKVAALFEDNGVINDLPKMMGSVLLYDSKDGNLLAIMDGGLITGTRTGAAGAVSCELFSRKDSKVVAMFGGGGQARLQIKGIKCVRDIQQVRVFSRYPQELPKYKEDIEKELGIEVVICETPAEAMDGADIAVSTTPTADFMADVSLVKPGMHIVAVGADMPGKNEWDPEIFGKADKVICDSIPQCLERGETRNAVMTGIISEKDIFAEIGEVLLGNKPSRESDDEITVFDTTGMGVQDNVTAVAVYEYAKRSGLGQRFEFI
ncbi:MAG: ornithine cyclodeaminase family protein [Firmicutes bacterium]|nr:ornithine cyclodeaminase family protein [Bacillota bacterium]MBQ5955194.1 ornithine cyclodeaminase family protein [Bacillota bacterium]